MTNTHKHTGPSLVIQGGTDSSPSQGNKISHAVQPKNYLKKRLLNKTQTFKKITYMYQGQKSDCSLRFAPVSPEHGMK